MEAEAYAGQYNDYYEPTAMLTEPTADKDAKQDQDKAPDKISQIASPPVTQAQ